ncbi:MAG: tagaturonate epimerase family protein [Melioribacteraceae bacterium]|nr:tagaturonate epimerase family protein [Melioribacteraceae bacterium]
MNIEALIKEINSEKKNGSELVEYNLSNSMKIEIYLESINRNNDLLFFIAKYKTEKYFFVITYNLSSEYFTKFDGILINSEKLVFIKECFLNKFNRKLIQEIFSFTKPVLTGLRNSFGFGDRIGLSNSGHLRALKGHDFVPILAQQSIRELTRTKRKPEDVMDAAVWAVFQEGYKDGFGADADHLKTTDDIDLMLNAGYTMFTFDPGDHVDNNADDYDLEQLKKSVLSLDWNQLNDNLNSAEERYLKNKIIVNNELQLEVNEELVLRAYAKYGKAIIHINKMFSYLKNIAGNRIYEVEISVDETESVTSIFEHFFFVNELTRLGVKFVSLAPRFIGEFEKGIDYKGDLGIFKEEYLKHHQVVKHFGNYKLSLHSGSDKFSVYEVIGSIPNTITHVKTAGTSYLEVLRVTAIAEPNLFREILEFSRGLYENERKTYHVSADLNKVSPADQYNDTQLIELFSQDDARQVLHVTFGSVLTSVDENGKYLFKERIINCLKKNEEEHYNVLIKHFNKHLDPFKM